MATTSTTAICLKRGDTWAGVFKWTTASDGTPYDLTGCTARLQVRLPVDAPAAYVRSQLPTPGARDYGAPIFDLSTDPDGGLTIDEALGYVYVRVDADETAALEIRSDYALDQELTFPDGIVVSTATLTMSVLEDVTS